MTPTIISGTDVQTFSSDFKSDMDIDMHKPMSSLDTDYRPDYDGKLILVILKLTYNLYTPIFIIGLSLNKINETPISNINTTSYDELRARNRQNYDKVQTNKSNYK